jgi:hypothetical protein
MSRADRTAGEIDWPAGFERTPADERDSGSKFSVSMGQAIDEIESELLSRIGADDWRISTAAPNRKKDGRPYADANPEDPGAVIRWSKDGQQYAVACDRYTGLRSNVRAIGLYIREKRKMSNRPVLTGQDEFATARLPSGNEGAIAGEPPAHEVLDIAPDAPEDVVKAAARAKKKETHPDAGGSTEAFQRVQRAEEVLLDAE